MEGVDALSYYDVECSFRLVETNCPDLLRLSASPRIQQVLFVAHSTLFTIQSMLRRWDGNTLLYTRDMFVALGLALTGRTFVMELHSLPERGPTRHWLKIVSRAATAIGFFASPPWPSSLGACTAFWKRMTETRESLAAQGAAMVRSKYNVTQFIDRIVTIMWDHKAVRWSLDAVACGDRS